eukprot:TRINITY_DN20317_c0_g1_i1.p2 TRINITY_DN20317_c0_g1~~TRINITY_DN20317_c0_g1_i1.p2  ORF type:complete len:100 (-),score=12.41 TRINITY_DN20317_c0_g1_i1:192-491(-)
MGSSSFAKAYFPFIVRPLLEAGNLPLESIKVRLPKYSYIWLCQGTCLSNPPLRLPKYSYIWLRQGTCLSNPPVPRQKDAKGSRIPCIQTSLRCKPMELK